MVPETVRVRVVDSTADYRWMVLPLRPAGTEGWDVQRLASIVREGDMIGVTIRKAGGGRADVAEGEFTWSAHDVRWSRAACKPDNA